MAAEHNTPDTPERLRAMLHAVLSADRAVSALATVFAGDSKQLYLVGGPVRDLLLGRQSSDLDFTTDSLPDDTETLIRQAGASAVHTIGARFGTIGGAVYDHHVEITTFRSEAYRPSDRHPFVVFGTNLEQDLSRRDLTINAMAVNVFTGDLIDLAGGQHDLERKLIRMVGNPAERFSEDPLRLMRVVRFATQLNFAIDSATSEAVKLAASSLREISHERVRDELYKILLSSHPDRGLLLLSELELLPIISPAVDAMRGMVDPEKRTFKDLFAHTLKVVSGTPANIVVRLAALLHDVGKPRTYTNIEGEVHFFDHERVGATMSRRLLSELKADHRTIEQVVHLVELHMRPATDTDAWTDKAVRRFIVDVGPEHLDSLLSLAHADITSSNPRRVAAHLDRLRRLRERCDALLKEASVVKPRSPLDGDELMALMQGEPGPWIGRVKQYLLNLVIDGELAEDDKTWAADLAKAFLARESL
jgi:poly(A) polymerase